MGPAPTIGAWRLAAQRRLAAGGCPSAALDARLLLAETLGLDAAALYLRADEALDGEAEALLEARLRRREGGEPVHRILGRRFFRDHAFALSPETLEPRPDTEALVDLAARELARTHGDRPFLFADVGTGSGIIAVSLLALLPDARAVALDLSEEALRTARRNAEAAGVAERFLPLRSDYLAALGGPLDAIVSNPPYIETAAVAGLSREVRDHDPLLALDGGADGLDAYRSIFREAPERLAGSGAVFVEIGAGQEGDVEGIAAANGFRLEAEVRDLSGTIRALHFSR